MNASPAPGTLNKRSSRETRCADAALSRAAAIPPGSDWFAFHVSTIVSDGSSWSAARARASVVRSTAARPAACVSPVS